MGVGGETVAVGAAGLLKAAKCPHAGILNGLVPILVFPKFCISSMMAPAAAVMPATRNVPKTLTMKSLIFAFDFLFVGGARIVGIK